MPLQNRVNPEGAIEKVSARGSFMGNRGVLHNSKKELQRQFKNKAWITCLLEFKGKQRDLMSPNAYTELFFLDEVTALAAGHRPCAECRWSRYKEFRNAWMIANQWEEDSTIRAHQTDGVLHRERVDGNTKVTWSKPWRELPHGTMFQAETDSYAVCDDKILKWSFEGYIGVDRERLPESVEVLTPRSVVNIFASGFRPEFHPTAGVRAR
jgi:hypothetical protein